MGIRFSPGPCGCCHLFGLRIFPIDLNLAAPTRDVFLNGVQIGTIEPATIKSSVSWATDANVPNSFFGTRFCYTDGDQAEAQLFHDVLKTDGTPNLLEFDPPIGLADSYWAATVHVMTFDPSGAGYIVLNDRSQPYSFSNGSSHQAQLGTDGASWTWIA